MRLDVSPRGVSILNCGPRGRFQPGTLAPVAQAQVSEDAYSAIQGAKTPATGSICEMSTERNQCLHEFLVLVGKIQPGRRPVTQTVGRCEAKPDQQLCGSLERLPDAPATV